MRALTVRDAGLLTTVQDAGRPGWAAIGVGRSGAADRGAYDRANRLVGNAAGAAALETVLGGLRLVSRADLVVAVTGTSAPVTVAGRARCSGAALRWPAGTELVVGTPAVGLRTYVAVRGGIDVPVVLGSRSHDTLGGIGPAPLRPGDVLPVGGATDGAPDRTAVTEAPHGATLVLDADPGPRADWVDLAALSARTWEVGPDLDRVGVRLRGVPLDRRAGELPSEGLVRGAVQVPANGLPVVVGADHPATGGYPVVAVLTDAASDRVAQARPGTRVVVRLRPA